MLRSTASKYLLWDHVMTSPSIAYLNQQKQLLTQQCCPTENVSSTLHATGMKARLGTQTNPSIPLLDRHVRFLNNNLNRRFLYVNTSQSKLELALAGILNLILWLGWLRLAEALTL